MLSPAESLGSQCTIAMRNAAANRINPISAMLDLLTQLILSIVIDTIPTMAYKPENVTASLDWKGGHHDNPEAVGKLSIAVFLGIAALTTVALSLARTPLALA